MRTFEQRMPDFLRLAEGNPGALSFIIDGFKHDPLLAESAYSRAKNIRITGSNLYILWNDCCERNTPAALYILKWAPIWVILQHIRGDGLRGERFDIFDYTPERRKEWRYKF